MICDVAASKFNTIFIQNVIKQFLLGKKKNNKNPTQYTGEIRPPLSLASREEFSPLKDVHTTFISLHARCILWQ